MKNSKCNSIKLRQLSKSEYFREKNIPDSAVLKMPVPEPPATMHVISTIPDPTEQLINY